MTRQRLFENPLGHLVVTLDQSLAFLLFLASRRARAFFFQALLETGDAFAQIGGHDQLSA
jgi:hypothetical protein